MTYSDKVKAGKVIVEKINSLAEGESFDFMYWGDRYTFSCTYIMESGKKLCSVAYTKSKGLSFDSMSVSNITVTSLVLFNFNMMNQKSTYKMDMSLMVLDIPVEV